MVAEDRWQALVEASAALHVALVEWMTAATPQTLAAVEDAARYYTRGLAYVIGLRGAQRYAMSLGAYRRATARLHALTATLSAAPSVDAADTEFLQRVAADQAAAGRAHEIAAADVVAAVKQARAQEQGGT